MSARELFGVLLVALGFPLRACSKTPIMERDTASHRKRPSMESCRPAIIVSFGVTAHWSPSERLASWADLTEGQRSRVTVSGNRFLAEFRRATEYRMTPTDRNTPFDPSQKEGSV